MRHMPETLSGTLKAYANTPPPSSKNRRQPMLCAARRGVEKNEAIVTLFWANWSSAWRDTGGWVLRRMTASWEGSPKLLKGCLSMGPGPPVYLARPFPCSLRAKASHTLKGLCPCNSRLF